MLSLLIPTYNYNIFQLVSTIHKQAENAKIPFEIICFDDASSINFDENQKINLFSNSHFEVLNTNIGRSKIRNLLAKKAKYNWLLFLDADVLPENENFISEYIKHIDSKFEIIFGGYKYQNVTPDNKVILRYKYGKAREEKPANQRNLKPYGSVFSGNLFVKKELFLANNSFGDINFYGMDIFFSYNLFKNKVPILHIDNAIYHLGLEANEVFFEKSLESVRSRKELMINLEGIEEINSLIKYYKFLKKYKFVYFYKFLFVLCRKPFKNNILSKNPNLLFFDLYRLGYLCSLENH